MLLKLLGHVHSTLGSGMEKVKDQILKSSLFLSGEEFTIAEMVTRTRSTRGTVERVISQMLQDGVVCNGDDLNRRSYKKLSVHWLNKMKLANYYPPREAKYQFHSEWLRL